MGETIADNGNEVFLKLVPHIKTNDDILKQL